MLCSARSACAVQPCACCDMYWQSRSLYVGSCDVTVQYCLVHGHIDLHHDPSHVAGHSCRVTVGQLGSCCGGGVLSSGPRLTGQQPLQEIWQLDTSVKNSISFPMHTCTVCMLCFCLFVLKEKLPAWGSKHCQQGLTLSCPEFVARMACIWPVL